VNAGRRGASGVTDVEVPAACTSCGVCCFSTLPEYIRVFGVDWDRMSERARELTEFIENRCYMRVVHDAATPGGSHCAALVVAPGAALAFTCSIYDERPDCCRALERGSGSCRADLHAKKARVAAEVERLIELRRGPAPSD
jgi:hypothetical protein